MAVIAPWLRSIDPVEIAQAAASTNFRARALADQEANNAAQRAAQQQEIGLRSQSLQNSSAALLNRLKLGYDRLAQTDAERRDALLERTSQNSAANLLRQQQQDLMSKHYADELTAKQGKDSAAQTLRDATNKDIAGFYSDLPTLGLGPSLNAHPLAATEPGIRSSAAQQLINPRQPSSRSIGHTDLTIPGAVTKTPGLLWGTNTSVGEPKTLKGVPLNSPLVNKFGSPELSAAAGTNYVDSLNGPAPSPLAVGGYKIGKKYAGGLTYVGGDPTDENSWSQPSE